MYLNMISILIDLIINEDLKGRRYILNVMETLIAHKEEKEPEGDSFWEGSVDEERLPKNTKFKIDLSCNLSLESWDNARRLVLAFDKKQMDI